jgi:L-amino acid N-acyltransferase YncA
MSDLKFTELTDKYLPDILEIYNYYVLNTSVSFHVKALSLEEMREITFFKNEKYKTIIVFLDNVLVGYGILSRYKARRAYDGSAEISIYLKQEYCGKGLGSKIISYMETEARNKGIHTLIAGICLNNASSIKLFEKNGYIKCAHFKEVGYKFGKYLDVCYFQKIL